MITLATVLLLMAQRGEFLPVTDLPYIDAIPLEWPDRREIIGKYVARVPRPAIVPCPGDCWWNYREATRLYLRDLPPETAGYVLGRMQGRQYLWQRHDGPNGLCWYWIDERWGR